MRRKRRRDATLRGPGRVVQLDGDGSLDRVISTGGLLTYPAGLTLSTDGALFVCETIPTGYPPGGGLIRVDLGSGAQTLFASGDPLNGPFDVTLAPDGWLWSIQHNVQLHEIPGPLVRTRVADGFSEIVPTDEDGGSVNGVTIRTDGRTLIADCVAIHGSCSIPDTKFYPDGLEGPRARVTGPLAFVPDMVTLDRKTSWGQLKLIYR